MAASGVGPTPGNNSSSSIWRQLSGTVQLAQLSRGQMYKAEHQLRMSNSLNVFKQCKSPILSHTEHVLVVRATPVCQTEESKVCAPCGAVERCHTQVVLSAMSAMHRTNLQSLDTAPAPTPTPRKQSTLLSSPAAAPNTLPPCPAAAEGPGWTP
jgi:hypothetical protein